MPWSRRRVSQPAGSAAAAAVRVYMISSMIHNDSIMHVAIAELSPSRLPVAESGGRAHAMVRLSLSPPPSPPSSKSLRVPLALCLPVTATRHSHAVACAGLRREKEEAAAAAGLAQAAAASKPLTNCNNKQAVPGPKTEF